MVNFKRQPGGCGCCGADCRWLFHEWDATGGGTLPAELELTTGASYNASQLHLEIEQGGACQSVSPNPNTAHGLVAFQIPASSYDRGYSDGMGFRVYFESDEARENYIYADLIYQEATGFITVDRINFWLVRLGKRVSSVDTEWTWALGTFNSALYIDPILASNSYRWLVLERCGCFGSNVVNGCFEGYAAHLVTGQQGTAIGGRVYDPNPRAFSATGVAQNPDIPTRGWGWYTGATHPITLSDPAGGHFGIERIDSGGQGAFDYMQVNKILVGAAGVPNASGTDYRERFPCPAPDFSMRAVCAESEPLHFTFTFNSISGVSNGRSTNMKSERTFRYVLYFDGTGNGNTPNVFETVNIGIGSDSSNPGSGSNDPLFPFYGRNASVASGESGWFSRGADSAKIECKLYMVWEKTVYGTDGIQVEKSGYSFEWEFDIAVSSKSLTCAGMVITLETADATVTDLLAGSGGSDASAPTTDLVITFDS